MTDGQDVDSRLGAGDPRRIGSYRTVARVGRGGMGQVYLARSPGGRALAVKVIAPELADDPEFRRRFALEAEAARLVGGFYTAEVVEAAPGDARPWLATAYIPGPTLQQAVREHGPLPTDALRVLGSGLAEGLAAIHRSGLVHRDLKPGNVMLVEDGPRVIDFGISRALDGDRTTNSVLGTPGYMSPEQCRGQRTSDASDIFALGCVLVYAVSGRSPYGEGSGLDLQYRTVHETPQLTGVPQELLPFLTRCLDQDPRRRPHVAEALAVLSGFSGSSGAVAPTGARSLGQDASWLPAEVRAMIEQRRALAARLPPEEPVVRAVRRRRAVVIAAVGALLAGAATWTATNWPDRGDGGGTSPTNRSMNPCDVLDNEIVQSNQLTDTGSPGGYQSDSTRVRTCKWASKGGDAEVYFTLAYGPATLELVRENRRRYPTDLNGLPGAQAYVNDSDFPNACEVTWLTSFGRVSVYADQPDYIIGGMSCTDVANFARSVFPKAPI